MDASGGSSANTTDEEAERSTPTPPAVTLTSATRQPGSSRNRSTASPRSAGGVAPSSRTKPSTRRARSFAFSFSFSSRVSSPAGPRPGRPTCAAAPRAGTRGRRCRTWFAMLSMTSLWCAKMTILGGAAASSVSAASPSAAALASGPPSSTRSTSWSHLIAPGSFTSAALRWRDTDAPRDAPLRIASSDARSSSLSPLVSPLVSLVSLASPSPSPSPRRWAPCRAVSMGTTCLRFGGRSARTCVFRRRIITSFVSSAWSSCSLLPPVRSYAGAGLGCSAGFGFGARATSFKSQ